MASLIHQTTVHMHQTPPSASTANLSLLGASSVRQTHSNPHSSTDDVFPFFLHLRSPTAGHFTTAPGQVTFLLLTNSTFSPPLGSARRAENMTWEPLSLITLLVTFLTLILCRRYLSSSRTLLYAIVTALLLRLDGRAVMHRIYFSVHDTVINASPVARFKMVLTLGAVVW